MNEKPYQELREDVARLTTAIDGYFKPSRRRFKQIQAMHDAMEIVLCDIINCFAQDMIVPGRKDE